MIALLASVFVASLIGSLHCVGMCGGFVAVYAGGQDGARRGRGWAHLAYNGGRLVTYTAVGAVVGAIGAAVDLAGTMGGIGRLAAWLAGGLMVAWGLVAIAQLLGWSPARLPFSGKISRFLGERYRRLREKPPVIRALLLGSLSTLLPCGWLYAFVVSAGATGSPVSGGLVMLAFWAGTVPALLGLGLGVQHLSQPLKRAIPWVSAVMIVGIGLLTIWYRTQLEIPWPSERLKPTTAEVEKQLKKPRIPTAPACHDQ